MSLNTFLLNLPFQLLRMKYSFILLITVLFLSSCNRKTELKKEFSCQSSSTLGTTEKVMDFKEGFSVDIPKKWKSSLYYDERQSEIFCADTIKTIDQTYLMEFALIDGKISVNPAFQKQVQVLTTEKELQLVQDGFVDFDTYKGYYHLGKSTHKDMEINIFQYYIQIDKEHYLLVKTDIYGSEKITERLCESIQLIESIQFIKDKK